jgi:hypothetical protein
LYCSPFNESEYWIKLAEERRVLAQHMPDDKCKQMMLQIAEDYEHLAKRNAKDPTPAPCLFPSRVPDCPASSWRAVAFSAGGDGGRKSLKQ